MAIDTKVPPTRRAVLAGGIGGLAALVAAALGRVDPVLAGTDGDVVLGARNDAGAPTTIWCLSGNALELHGDEAGLKAFGTHGNPGVVAFGDIAIHAVGGIGVLGEGAAVSSGV